MTGILLSLAMGALLGYSAHRAGLCTVKAAAEILTSRRSFFLLSFAKSAGWVMGLTAAVGALGHTATFNNWPVSTASVLGGVLFGIGAGLNGGCTFSTISRIMDGNAGYLLTFAGWIGGMGIAKMLPVTHPIPVVMPQAELPLTIVLLICIGLLWESIRIVRRFWRKHSLRRILGASAYTLSAGAALVGISNAVIIEATGTWSFSSTILCTVGARSGTSCSQSLLAWGIFVAALMGMVASSLQRGSFKPRLPKLSAAIRHGAGGVLMGLGTVFVPGGNDGLILFAIPSLSPHAVPAYIGLFSGILGTLALMQVSGMKIPPVQCSGDICRSE